MPIDAQSTLRLVWFLGMGLRNSSWQALLSWERIRVSKWSTKLAQRPPLLDFQCFVKLQRGWGKAANIMQLSVMELSRQHLGKGRMEAMPKSPCPHTSVRWTCPIYASQELWPLPSSSSPLPPVKRFYVFLGDLGVIYQPHPTVLPSLVGSKLPDHKA